MAPDGPIESREAMEPWDHPWAMESRRMPSMATGDHAWPALVFTVSACIYYDPFVLIFHE